MNSGSIFRTPAPLKSAAAYFQQRQRQRALRAGQSGYPIRVEQIAHPDHLFRCWMKQKAEGGQAPGVDGYTYGMFSPTEVGIIVKDLSNQIHEGSYRPEPVRPVSVPKKPEKTKFRTLKIGVLCDRVVGKAVDEAFKPFWKTRFSPTSFGFRPQRSSWGMLAALEVAMQKTGRRVLAIDDVKTAFDTVPVDEVIQCHRRALEKAHQTQFNCTDQERTLKLIDAVLRGSDVNRSRGIDQGGPYSPAAMNVLFNEHLDQNTKKIGSDLLQYRYADNLCYLCRSMPEGECVLKEVNRLLVPLEMQLKGEDGVKDLHRGDVAHLMGFSLRWSGNHLCYEVEPNTFDHLRQLLGEAHVTPDPAKAAFQVVLGWVTAYAPAFESGDVADVLTVAVECGFRELPLNQIQQCQRVACMRWQHCRDKARRRYRNGCNVRAASPPSTDGFI